MLKRLEVANVKCSLLRLGVMRITETGECLCRVEAIEVVEAVIVGMV